MTKDLVIVVRLGGGHAPIDDRARMIRAALDAVPGAVSAAVVDTGTPEAQIALLRARAELEERIWAALRRDE